MILPLLLALAQEKTIDVGGVKRTYLLHAPKSDKPLPLVVVLHGAGSNGRQTEALTGFNDIADKNAFAVAYPDGLNRTWKFVGDSDVKFLDALIDAEAKDPKRVYVTGLSNGAFMTNHYACERPDKVAAIAPIAGTGGKRLAPKKPIPVLYVHGTDDSIMRYDPKALVVGAEDLVRLWAKTNACEEKPTIEKLPDAKDDGTTVELWVFAGDVEVRFYKVIGGGHTWPGSRVEIDRLLGKTTQDFSASEAIWDFFARFEKK